MTARARRDARNSTLDFHANRKLLLRGRKQHKALTCTQIITVYGSHSLPLHCFIQSVVQGSSTQALVARGLTRPCAGIVCVDSYIPSIIRRYVELEEHLFDTSALSDDLIRVSVGIESVVDLVADLERALATV